MKNFIFIFLLSLTSFHAECQEKEIAYKINRQLKINNQETGLNYPGSVKRFYEAIDCQPAWVKPQNGMGKTWEAMLMLDCVLQFGLAHKDYHVNELSYERLHIMLEQPEKIHADEKARFDIMLTDAMITFMNHLHYGKFNPDYPPERIDMGNGIPLLADEKLRSAMLENDLMTAVLDVQPKNKAYKDLQLFMHLVKGQYTGDCYEVPEADVRLAAINMERLRWAAFGDIPYLHINIPSFTLKLCETDSVYNFKIIVGKPGHPTPTLRSAIGYFTTAPDWKVPQELFVEELLPLALKQNNYFNDNKYTVYDQVGNSVDLSNAKLKEISKHPSAYSLRQSSGQDQSSGAVVFLFPNNFDIYLHDSPDQRQFNGADFAMSYGNIEVERATDLAALLLKYDGAQEQILKLRKNAAKYIRSNFILKSPLPIRVTYITCAYKDGRLLRYPDIYSLDERLQRKLYNLSDQLVLK